MLGVREKESRMTLRLCLEQLKQRSLRDEQLLRGSRFGVGEVH